MKTVFEGALRKATALTSRQHVVEATKTIQDALAAARLRDRSIAKTQPASTSAQPSKPAQPAFVPASANRETHEPERPQGSPLADLLGMLREQLAPTFDLKAPITEPAHKVEGDAADGGRFVSRSFSSAFGARRYKLFIPSAVQRGEIRNPALIVMLHGCKQDPDDFALGTGMNALAEEQGFLVVYPQQSSSSNQMGCWNWFNVKDQMRESGEPAIIAGITAEAMEEFSVDRKRVFVAGLSAGGAMAAILGVRYHDLYQAVGIHSGLPCGAASDMASAFSSMHSGAVMKGVAPPEVNVRTIVFQGGGDRTVHPSNAELIVAFASAGLDAPKESREDGRSAGGEPYERIVIADAKGVPQVEYWSIEGLGHAWSGGYREGSFTDPKGPDASREMVRFFMQQ